MAVELLLRLSLLRRDRYASLGSQRLPMNVHSLVLMLRAYFRVSEVQTPRGLISTSSLIMSYLTIII